MLYLIVNKQDQPEHVWSIDPDKDFEGLRVIGPAVLDVNGKPADSAWLVPDGQTFKIDNALKSAAVNADNAAQAKVAADRAARANILKTIGSISTIDEVKAALRAVIEELRGS